MAVPWQPGGPAARVEAHGDGAAWLLARAPRQLGCEDDVAGSAPGTPPLLTAEE